MQISCMFCHTTCTSELPHRTVVSGAMICPVCLERIPDAQFEKLRRPKYAKREGDPIPPNLEDEVQKMERGVRHRGYFIFLYSAELDSAAVATNFERAALAEILEDYRRRLLD